MLCDFFRTWINPIPSVLYSTSSKPQQHYCSPGLEVREWRRPILQSSEFGVVNVSGIVHLDRQLQKI